MLIEFAQFSNCDESDKIIITQFSVNKQVDQGL